jgi:demethylmenaquinone methyltransferase / 2-methoxy-6-polyprenyl-1,4-benzoquinol methylase
VPEATSIKMMFAGISPRYDLLNRLLSFGIDRIWRRRAVAALGASASGRVLDICCGTGDLGIDLSAAGGTVTGVDFCHEMLVLGRGKSARGGRALLRVAEADALRLPFSEGCFSAVAVAFGVRNLQDLDGGLREMARVLRPGGRLAVLEFGRPRAAAMRVLYAAYLNVWVPLVGRLVSGDGKAYAYLSSSIQAFPDQTLFPARLQRAGFTGVRCEDLTGGIAALYVAVKPAV